MQGTINLKIVLLGDANTAKTSILNTYLGNEFPIQYLPTIGNKTAKKEYNIEEKEILMNIWIDDLKEIIANLDKLKELHPKELKLHINEISSTIESFKKKFIK